MPISSSLTTDEAPDPGRSCPLHYRYRPEDMAMPATLSCDVLYVVGGLYGNPQALDEVLRLFDLELGDKRLVFNGDFHWFDTDPATFERISKAIFDFDAIRGNVETELADPDADPDAGCGCAYPDWVGQGVVERSNRIMTRLRATAQRFPQVCRRLAALPMFLRADVGDSRVGIVHGDALSLAGWGFAQEALLDAEHRRQVSEWFDRAEVDVFASSHTCLPVLQSWLTAGEREAAKVLINNGAAGMPNLADAKEGLLTRISTRRFDGPQRRFGNIRDGVFIDGLAIVYDQSRWQQSFLAAWPDGSDAHDSYWARISEGSGYSLDEVVRTQVGL